MSLNRVIGNRDLSLGLFCEDVLNRQNPIEQLELLFGNLTLLRIQLGSIKLKKLFWGTNDFDVVESVHNEGPQADASKHFVVVYLKLFQSRQTLNLAQQNKGTQKIVG